MDPDSYWLSAFLILFSLLVIAFVSMAEVALASLSRLRLRRLVDMGDGKSVALQALVDNPDRYMATFIVLKIAAIMTGTGAVIWLLLAHRPAAHLVWWLVGFYLLLLLVKMGIRGVALRDPDRVAGFVAPFVRVLVALFSFLTSPLHRWGRLWAGSGVQSIFFSEDGLQYLVNRSVGEGLVEAEEREMIGNIFAFSERLVREVMVSRLDIVALPQEASFAEALKVINDAGHSRIPVYKGNIDQVVGLLYAKDLLQFVQQHREDIFVRDMMRTEVYFVPESKRVNDLLNEMKAKQVHIAIVVDEYGGTAGLVTIEDLVEEIVGEIQDEYDQEPAMFEERGGGAYDFDARLNLDEVNELLGTAFSTEGETLGGFIYDVLETIPEVGQDFIAGGWRFTVLDMDGQRIGHVRVEKLPEAVEEPVADHKPHHGPLSLLF